MFDITAIGEVLVDFATVDAPAGKLSMTGSAGGAPCNVLVQAARLGAKTAFLGSVGDDIFGRFLLEETGRYGVDTSAVSITQQASTTLAVVSFDKSGDRSFDFVRSPGADSCLQLTKDMEGILDHTRILQYGTFAMSKEPMCTTLFEILERYKGRMLFAYDPNLRETIWKDAKRMRAFALRGMEYASLLKLGDDEAMFIMERDSVEEAVAEIQRRFGIEIILVTKGRAGCEYYYKNGRGALPSYAVDTVDTCGAGDAFFGALLSCIAGLPDVAKLSMEQLGEFVRFANACGAISTTRRGTMDAMPTRAEIEAFLAEK